MMEKKSDDVTFESAIEILTKKHPNIMNQNCVQLFGIPEMESFEGAGKKEVENLKYKQIITVIHYCRISVVINFFKRNTWL